MNISFVAKNYRIPEFVVQRSVRPIQNGVFAVVHIFTDFGNIELGHQVRQAHRQNYRHLAIQYPHIEIIPFFVYPEDDQEYGHHDVYKSDFWEYPWPKGLIDKLTKFDRDPLVLNNIIIPPP